MEYFLTWLEFSGVGILFGLFSLNFSYVDLLGRAVRLEHKKVPSWMHYVVGSDPRAPKFDLGIHTERSARITLWSISTLWAIGCLVFSNRFAVVNAGGNTVKFIIIQITSPVFVLLTWLLPIYFLRRYLARLKPGDNTTDKPDLPKH